MAGSESKKIHEICEWPPASWATSGESNLLLYPNVATIEKAVVVHDGIALHARQDGKQFSTHINISGHSERKSVADAFNGAAGMTVNDGGNIPI